MNVRLLAGGVALLGALWLGLYSLKDRVQDLEREADALRRAVAAEHENLRALRAEWAYLERPQRLERLAGEIPRLRPMRPDQVIEWADLPAPAGTP